MSDRLLDLARAVARRYRSTAVSMDDLRQEAYLAMLAAARSGVSDEPLLLFRARRRLRTLVLREERTRSQVPLPRNLHAPGPGPPDQVASEDLLEQLWLRARHCLTDRELDILERTYWDSAGDARIATELGISRAAVCRARQRAIGKLREFFPDCVTFREDGSVL